MDITIYATPTCNQCKVFKKKLEDKSIDFFYIDNIDDTIKMSERTGITTAPIVEIDGRCYDLRQAMEILF